MNGAAAPARRAAYLFLAFVASTVVWIVCISTPILVALVLSVPSAIAAGLWEYLTGGSISGMGIDVFMSVLILLITFVLMPRLSTAILRFALRLSPLPIGGAAGFQLAPILWLSWLLVLGAFAGSDAEGITIVVAVIMGVVGMGRVYHFRSRWQGFPRGRIVLFLRRFGRTADRLVSTAIRRAVPEDASLALLVGARQGAASWDPIVISFAGLSGQALPHYLQSTDDAWVRHVKEMVLRADAIVLDATDWSEAMDTELSVVHACGATNRLIVLERQNDAPEHPMPAHTRLQYRVSWRQATERMFLGSLLTLLPAVIGDSLGWSVRARTLATIPAVLAWLFLAVRPVMDAGAAAELSRALKTLGRDRSVAPALRRKSASGGSQIL